MSRDFNWSLYLALAKELQTLVLPDEIVDIDGNILDNNAFKEAYYRTAISRAYYAAFCIARNYLRDTLQINISKVDAHNFVIHEFKERRNLKNSHNIANTLYSLRQYRNDADYNDIPIINLDKKVQYAIKESQRVISLIAQL
jgi:uncharacterized protein (UPF0332 family)